MSKTTAKALIAAVGLLGSSCRFLIAVDGPMCDEDADCQDRFEGGDSYRCSAEQICERLSQEEAEQALWETRYPCLFEAPDIATRSADPKTVRVRALDYYFEAPVQSTIHVRACDVKDSCTRPLFEGEYDDSIIELTLPGDFDGYLELQAEGYTSMLAYNKLLMVDDSPYDTVLFIPEGIIKAVTEDADDMLEPDTGLVLVEMLDCDGRAADGVSIIIDDNPDIPPWYIDGLLPNREVTASVITDQIVAGRDMAVGGFTNVPSSNVSVTGQLKGTDIVFDRLPVAVRDTYVTMVLFYPGAR